MKMVEVDGLTKKYKDKVAVDHLSIHIEECEIYSFLGLNGAGKTTTIKMLNGLSRPTSGTARVMSFDLIKDLDDIKRISSISPQESAISYRLTVRENIEFMGRIHGLDKNETRRRCDELIAMFSLSEFQNKLSSKLSGGYQRRLSIAMALISNPRILYLDEPTLGLDVIARRELWKLIRKLKESMTIILTTHYLEEVEALSDHIGIIKDGSLLFEGTLDELYERTSIRNIEESFIRICGGEE